MTRQHKPKEDFETIPQASRYEINSFGILRNRETKRILKWQVHEHGHKYMALWAGDKKSRRLSMQFALVTSRED